MLVMLYLSTVENWGQTCLLQDKESAIKASNNHFLCFEQLILLSLWQLLFLISYFCARLLWRQFVSQIRRSRHCIYETQVKMCRDVWLFTGRFGMRGLIRGRNEMAVSKLWCLWEEREIPWEWKVVVTEVYFVFKTTISCTEWKSEDD